MKLLIGTRETDHSLLLRTLFQRNGWDVTCCAGLPLAETIAMVEPPDAILLDPWQDNDLLYLNQVMRSLWEHRVTVVFLTTQVNAEQLGKLASFRPDLIVKLPEEMSQALPRRVQELVANDVNKNTSHQFGSASAVTY